MKSATKSNQCQTADSQQQYPVVVENHIQIAKQIAARLKRRYTWVAMEDLYSYSLLGLTMSARAFDPSRGVPFPNFAAQKGLFWAIDEMRKDGILRRKSSANMPRIVPFSEAVGSSVCDENWTPDVEDNHSHTVQQNFEIHDLCVELLNRITPQERDLIILYYKKQLTFRQISQIFGISESSVCLMHKALIQKLRRLAVTMRVA